MSVHTFTLPATVAFKAQGIESVIDVNTLHPDAIAAIFTYGARRWMQDHVNAAANVHAKAVADAKEKGESVPAAFDAQACIAARLESAVSGKLSTRGEGSGMSFTEQEEALYAIANDMKAAKGWESIAKAFKDAKGMDTDSRKATVLKAVAALPDDRLAKVKAAAAARIATARELAALAL